MNVNPDSFDDANGFFPKSFATAYTTDWESTVKDDKNDPKVAKDANVVCNNKKEYVFAVRREAKALGLIDANTILTLFKNPRLKATVELTRTTSFSTANLIKLNVDSFAIENEKLTENLRLVGQEFSDFKTILELEEDESTIGT